MAAVRTAPCSDRTRPSVTDLVNIRYLTLHRSAGLLVVGADAATLVTDERYGDRRVLSRAGTRRRRRGTSSSWTRWTVRSCRCGACIRSGAGEGDLCDRVAAASFRPGWNAAVALSSCAGG